MATAIEMKLDQFFLEPTLKDFVCAPDWKLEEKRYLKNVATVRGLRVVADTYCEEQLPVISKKYDLLEMVKILETQPSKSEGRYRLLPEEEKPSYNDIAGEVAANESIIKKIQSLAAGSGDEKRAEAEVAMEEPEADDNDMDISFDSDKEETFFTANDTFISDTPSKISDSVTPTNFELPKLCDIPLPQETSTPAKATSKKEDSGERKNPKSKASQSRWDKTSRTKAPKSSPVSSNVVCGERFQGATLSKPPTPSSVQRLEKRVETPQQPVPPPPLMKSTPFSRSASAPFLPSMNVPSMSPMQSNLIKTPSEPCSAPLSHNSWPSNPGLLGNGSSQQFQGNSSQQFPGNGLQQFPGNGNSQQFPGNGSQQFPGNGSQQFPGNGSQQFPGNGSQQFPGNGNSQQFPGNGSQQFPGNGSQQFPGNSSSQLFPGNGSSQQFPGNGSSQQFPGNGSSQQFHVGMVDHQQQQVQQQQVQHQQQNIDVEAGLPATTNSWSQWAPSNNLWQQEMHTGESLANHQHQQAPNQAQIQLQPTFPCEPWRLSCNYPSTFSTYDETR